MVSLNSFIFKFDTSFKEILMVLFHVKIVRINILKLFRVERDDSDGQKV